MTKTNAMRRLDAAKIKYEVKEYEVDENDLSGKHIADAAAVSTRECLRCFRASIRQSPMEYLIDYRIRTARKLLETTDLPVTEVALRCGFNSPSYFTKQFHSICGVTPNACRKAKRQ